MGAVCRGDRPDGRRGQHCLLLRAERRHSPAGGQPVASVAPAPGGRWPLFCSTGFAAWRRTRHQLRPGGCAGEPALRLRTRPSSSPPRCSPTCWAAPPAGKGPSSRWAAPSPPRSDGGCTGRHKDSRIITMCGMSAAFSALFGTPLTAAMFAMEVTSVGVLYYAAIVPCVLSAIIGLWVAQLCGVPPTAFSLQGVPQPYPRHPSPVHRHGGPLRPAFHPVLPDDERRPPGCTTSTSPTPWRGPLRAGRWSSR